MSRLSPEAERNIDALILYHEEHERPLAAKAPLAAVDRAILEIEHSPIAGLMAPRPYPALVQAGRRWIKQGGYWIAYTTTRPATIAAIFHESADIPGRVRAADARDGT